MFLKNQTNQNLISQISNFANQIKQSGKSPEQLFDEVLKSGKYSDNQISEAKKKAEMVMKILRK